jgi:tetratricopeptide (TPR) repeat protein
MAHLLSHLTMTFGHGISNCIKIASAQRCAIILVGSAGMLMSVSEVDAQNVRPNQTVNQPINQSTQRPANRPDAVGLNLKAAAEKAAAQKAAAEKAAAEKAAAQKAAAETAAAQKAAAEKAAAEKAAAEKAAAQKAAAEKVAAEKAAAEKVAAQKAAAEKAAAEKAAAEKAAAQKAAAEKAAAEKAAAEKAAAQKAAAAKAPVNAQISANRKIVVERIVTGTLLRQTGEFRRAIAEYNQAIELDANDPNAYNDRGLVRRATRDNDLAIADFDQVIQLDPENLDAYVNRGLIYEAKGDFSRAGNEYRRAISLSPKNDVSKRYQETARVRLALLEDGSTNQPATVPPSDVPTSDRRALVIGNGKYASFTALPNAPNDARVMAAKLREIGFDVTEGIDLGRDALTEMVKGFLRDAASANTVLIYFAGHGMQIHGKNYLVPIDMKLEDVSALGSETLDLDTIVVGLDDQIRSSIIILDACRNNPFVDDITQAATNRSISLGSGLAEPTNLGAGATAGAGTLIAFATSPGKVALDGEGGNSPFTTALVRHMSTPGLEVQTLLTRVRSDVVAATNNKQVPWSNSSLLGEVYLVK